MNTQASETLDVKRRLRENELLGALDDIELERLLKGATRLAYQAGETIMEQGAEGDGILVVLSGKVRVIDERHGEKPVILGTLGRGTNLGEQAFVSGEPLESTVKAAEDLDVLRLATADLRQVLSRVPEFRKRLEFQVKRDAEFHFLRTLNLLSVLEWWDTEKLLDAVETVTLPAGEFLFHEGDLPDGAYIIRSGEVEIYKESAGDAPVAELKPGALLGEIALHSGGPRNASAKAKSECVLLRLKKADYDWITAEKPIGEAIARISQKRLQLDDFLAYRATTPEGRAAILGLLHTPGGVDRFWQLAEQEKQGPESSLQHLAGATSLDYLVPTPNLLLDPELVRQVPAQYLHANQVLPIFMDEERVEVLVGTPFLGTVPSELSRMLDRAVSLRITEPKYLAKLIESSTAGQGGLGGALGEFDEEKGLEELDSIEDLKDQAQAAPIVKLVNNYFMEAISRKASDIHIDPYEEGIEVRYRIDGILHLVATAPRRFQPAIVSRIKIMSNLDIAERRIPQDGRISLRLESRSYDIRVATIPTVFGEGVVMRILDKSSIQVAVEDVGFSPEMLATWKQVVTRPNGVVLVTGPTGSGKTTTLYATLNHIKKPELKLITAEDPVEYQLHGIEQVQINTKVDMTFAAALRSMLRLDPDIIMVGEIRDFETAEIAVQAALTGHLVFSTLHTNDAPTAITRLVEMGIAPYLIASSLNAALAQRLVRRLCTSCREQTADGQWQAAGCSRCDGTGYKGRLGIYELMVVDDPIRELIVQNKDAAVIGAEARRQGMLTLWEDGMAKVAQGLTSEEELRRVAG